jgi:hypothetical protein
VQQLKLFLIPCVSKKWRFPCKVNRGKQKYYPIKASYDKATWELVTSAKPPKYLKQEKLYIDSFEQKAAAHVRDIDFFSFNKFENSWNSETPEGASLLESLIIRSHSYFCRYKARIIFDPQSFYSIFIFEILS